MSHLVILLPRKGYLQHLGSKIEKKLSAYDSNTDTKLAEHEAQRKEKMRKHQSYADQSSRPRTPMEPGHQVITQNMKTHLTQHDVACTVPR